MQIRPLVFALATVAFLSPLASGGALAADKKDKGTFVAIDTLTASVIAPNGRHQVMTIQSGVDVPDPALHALAELVQPRLRDAYTQVIQLYAGVLPPGLPSTRSVASCIRRAT